MADKMFILISVVKVLHSNYVGQNVHSDYIGQNICSDYVDQNIHPDYGGQNVHFDCVGHKIAFNQTCLCPILVTQIFQTMKISL